ncbi:uncharacterized protein E0L32_004188 [Thyridium curvatum]|uniref:DUF6594 domain-containing protein n=1 Tax=Thyridium curvatum TaxID=1093900 RepID=A0A507B930_9PEZI|nr:uncharacterized protein E0L32_004188 [Thyridium curvatum]TPX16193.1 hypothetical protein E0L32_004188 [Thyridium curvatum]
MGIIASRQRGSEDLEGRINPGRRKRPSARSPDRETPSVRRRRRGSRTRSLSPFGERLVSAATRDLRVAPLFNLGPRKPLVRLRILQYMSIVHMKRKIAHHVALIRDEDTVSERQLDEIGVLMKEYIGAIRDLKFMLEPTSQYARTANFLKDFFYLERKHDSAVLLDTYLDKIPAPPRELFDISIPEYSGFGGFSYKSDEQEQNLEAYFGRFFAAVLSGVALIGPMLFMKLYNDLLAQLVTASVCVLIVGGVLSTLEEVAKKDVVALTAGYAAVLVVFIGANS